jgi:hypothetical protein
LGFPRGVGKEFGLVGTELGFPVSVGRELGKRERERERERVCV